MHTQKAGIRRLEEYRKRCFMVCRWCWLREWKRRALVGYARKIMPGAGTWSA